MKPKVLIGMSGGVDSTVTALRLQNSGFDIVGVYMKLHNNEAYHKENFAKAKLVANYLGIDIHFLDISDEFNTRVYNYFIDSYKEGKTPNPCVVCNREIKFGYLVEFANKIGAKKIATGHYVRSDGEYLYRAKDKNKDQSYFLARVKKEVIPKLIFPLGDSLKDDIKAEASKIEILKDIAKQKESSEICFVEDSYVDVLAKHIDVNREGEVLNENGEVVGSHKGYMHYTVGKRRGFSVRGAHEPHYVLELNPAKNQIIVGTKEALAKDEFEIKDINLFDDLRDFECEVKVRYRTKAIRAKVSILDNGRGIVKLYEKVFGLAKGQFAVFYDNDKLLGGGEIV